MFSKQLGTSKTPLYMVFGIVLIVALSLGVNVSANEIDEVELQPTSGNSPSEIGDSSRQLKSIQDAAELWDQFMSKHADDLQHVKSEDVEILHRIALARVKDEGIEAFHDIAESLHDGDVREEVLNHLFEEVVQSDPQLASDAAFSLERKVKVEGLYGVSC